MHALCRFWTNSCQVESLMVSIFGFVFFVGFFMQY